MNTKMKLRMFVSLLAFCIFVLQMPTFGVPYPVGNYVVDVDVRNTAMVLIPNPKVKVWISEKVIYVKASAAGYLSQQKTIVPSGNTGYFKRDFELQDVPKQLSAEDMLGRPIQSAYFTKDQYGFAPNVYGITVFIPKVMWPKPVSRNIDVFDAFWGIPLKQSCVIDVVDEYYRVKMTVDRRDLDWTDERYFVVVDTGKKVPPNKIRGWLSKLKKVEENQEILRVGCSQDLAAFLFYTLPRKEVEAASNGDIPSTLKSLYDHASRFSALHLDPEEKNEIILQ